MEINIFYAKKFYEAVKMAESLKCPANYTYDAVAMEWGNGVLNVVRTDGHRLIHTIVEGHGPKEDLRICIRGNTLKSLTNHLKLAAKRNTHITITKRSDTEYVIGDVLYETELPVFVEWRRVIPGKHSKDVSVTLLASEAQNLKILCEPCAALDAPLRLELAYPMIRVTQTKHVCKNVKSIDYDILTAEYSAPMYSNMGSPVFKMACNPHYLQWVLHLFKDHDLKMETSSSPAIGPILITSEKMPDTQIILMPMRG